MERIFYRTDVHDEPLNVPIYIFDTSFLPLPDVINYDEFVETMVTLLPREKYTLVMFSSGLNRISWVWGLKFLKRFLTDDANIRNVTKILSVHDGWFVKSLTTILANYNLTRKGLNALNRLLETFSLNAPAGVSRSIIVNCATLAELNNYVDITKLKISLNTYKHDYLLTMADGGFLNKALGAGAFKPFDSHNFSISETSSDLSEQFKYHLYQILNIINAFGPRVELLFHKPGKKINSEIFYHCVKRNQILWINDWDMYCIGTTFKKLINDLPLPLVPRAMVVLPIRNDNIAMNFNTIFNHHTPGMQAILIHLLNMFRNLADNEPTTKLKSLVLARSFATCLSFEVNLKANETNMIIINTFVRKLIDRWGDMRRDYSVLTIDEILHGRDIDNRHGDESYLHYDMTAEEEETDSESIAETEFVGTESILPEELSPVKRQQANNVLKSNPNLLNRPTPSPIKTAFPADGIPNKTVTFASPTKLERTFVLESPTKITAQYPCHKYKFSPSKVKMPELSTEPPKTPNFKRPVIRGRKVGELARLYEERAQGLELLKGM